MVKVVDGFDLPYKTSLSVGDILVIRDNVGNPSFIAQVATTNPAVSPSSTTTTTSSSTLSTSSTSTSSTTQRTSNPPTTDTTTDTSTDTSTATIYPTSSTTAKPDPQSGDKMDDGKLSGGTYPDEDTANDSTVGYTLVDLATGVALITQTLSLDSLFDAIKDTYGNYSILSGQDVTIKVSLSALDDDSNVVSGNTTRNTEYVANNSTVSI